MPYLCEKENPTCKLNYLYVSIITDNKVKNLAEASISLHGWGDTVANQPPTTRGVHGSGKPHGNPIPMGIAIRLMMGMGMGMGIKPMGMGIAYISRV